MRGGGEGNHTALGKVGTVFHMLIDCVSSLEKYLFKSFVIFLLLLVEGIVELVHCVFYVAGKVLRGT